MTDAEDIQPSTLGVELAGSGQAGHWTITAWVTAAATDRWQIEVERSQCLFSDFSFNVPGPGVVEEIMAFVEQTLGSQQYGDLSVEVGGQESRTFTCPRLAVGRFAGVPVALYKDGAEDRYFVVVSQFGQGALRFVILGEELRELLEALGRLKGELSAWIADTAEGATGSRAGSVKVAEPTAAPDPAGT